ncbi:MAG: 1-deoxy-D-xylulose-5-phosphate reductoisomerase [Erysipelotrichales bacterium]|nr:1-deoxy-D-xylulose-5-phosphate reductoisomerase [Erysipelotrichales bacterium]
MIKKIILLGATGSIGSQTLDVLRINKALFSLAGVSLGSSLEKSIAIITEFKPTAVVVRKNEHLEIIRNKFPELICLDCLEELASFDFKGAQMLVNALSGFTGMLPTVAAIKAKKDILLANKETLVVAGELIMPLVKKHNVRLIPIDSEHSAIFQCLVGEDSTNVKKMLITASGGSLRDKKREDLKAVTVSQVLAHPNWSMGQKITVDSATMMNKGLEVIEAHHLFQIPYQKIETVLHYQSIIHSMVVFNDNSIKAQLGTSDMRMPISYALGYPKRLDFVDSELDLCQIGNLTFKAMDFERFPLLKLSYEAGIKGGNLPCILNAANEAAVALFLAGKIPFLKIEEIVSKAILEAEFQTKLDFNYLFNLHNKYYQEIINKYGEV